MGKLQVRPTGKTGKRQLHRNDVGCPYFWEQCGVNGSPLALHPVFLSCGLLRPRDLKDRVTGCLTLESLRWRVFRGIEVRTSRSGLEKILFENRSCLLCWQFSHGERLRTAATCQRCRPCCPEVAYPLHHSVRRN